MKLVYVAGPYMSSLEGIAQYHEITDHILEAEEVSLRLAERGIGFFCPHTHTAHFEAKVSVGEQFYKDLDMELLKKCDAIVLIKGWHNSSGSKAERAYAESVGMPIFDLNPGTIDEWDRLMGWYFGSD